MAVTIPDTLAAAAARAHRVTVFTGAGMSAESGVPTFRDAQTGLWARFDPMLLATTEAFADDPELVWAWYVWRRQLIGRALPNAGHRAIAELARLPGVEVRVITQNVDDLHERAGSEVLSHLHGSLFELRCFDCEAPWVGVVDEPGEQVERLAPPRCEECGGLVRPGVVWFGEMLPADAFERAENACLDTDLLLVVGTSGLVFPAAGLPLQAQAAGVPTAELNPEETELSELAGRSVCSWRTTAGEGLPALVERMRGER